MEPPLALDLTRLLPGPLAGRILRELGLRVHRLVPPQGDLLATHSPETYAWLQEGKTEETVDLKTEEGRARLLELAREASVLLESNRPGVMERLGVGPSVLRSLNVHLTYIRIGGYSDPGFREAPGHDLTYLAAAGLLERFGSAWRDVQLADGTGALWAVIAAQRGMLQGGGFFEVELERAPQVFSHELRGLDGSQVCYCVYEALEGRVAVAALEPHLWARLCEALGHPEWSREGGSSADEGNPVWRSLSALLRSRGARDWEAFGLEHSLPLRAVRQYEGRKPLRPW